MANSPFGFDAPEHSPGFLLWQTTTCWQRLIKKSLEEYNVSHSQFVIMAILLWWQNKDRNITQVDVINMSNLDKMTVSKSLKKLCSIGLVVRTEHKEDTRVKLVFLTSQGIDLIKKLVPIVESIDANFFGKLKKDQESNLISILQKLTGAQY